MSEGAEEAKRRFADAADLAVRKNGYQGEELEQSLAKNQALRETTLNDKDECEVVLEDYVEYFEFYQVHGRWRVHFSDVGGGYELEETEDGDWTDDYEDGEEES